jgi:hypothetical protein
MGGWQCAAARRPLGAVGFVVLPVGPYGRVVLCVLLPVGPYGRLAVGDCVSALTDGSRCCMSALTGGLQCVVECRPILAVLVAVCRSF